MYIDLAEVMRLKGRLVDISSEIDGTLKNVNNELDTICSTINSDNLIQANNSIKEKVLTLSTNLVNNLNKLTEFMGTQLENYTVSYQEAESALQSLVNHLNSQYGANGVISYDTTSVVESASPTAIVGAAGIAGLGAVSAGAMYSPNYVTTDYSMGSSGNHNVGVSPAQSMGTYTTYFPNSSTSINEFFSNSGNYTAPATPATATTLSATKSIHVNDNISSNTANSSKSSDSSSGSSSQINIQPSIKASSGTSTYSGSYNFNEWRSKVPDSFTDKELTAMLTACERNGISPSIAAGLIKTESGWKADAGSSAGAYGYTQLLAKYHDGVASWSTTKNIETGINELGALKNKYGDINVALACYNAGEGGYKKGYGRGYAKKVIKNAQEYR